MQLDESIMQDVGNAGHRAHRSELDSKLEIIVRPNKSRTVSGTDECPTRGR